MPCEPCAAVQANRLQAYHDTIGKIQAIDHAHVSVRNAKLLAGSEAVVYAFENSEIHGGGGSTIHAHNDSIVHAYMHSKVYLRSPLARTFAYSGSTVVAESGIVFCSGKYNAKSSEYGELYAKVTASGNSVVHAEYDCAVEALEGALVYANDAEVVARSGCHVVASGKTRVRFEKGAVVETRGLQVTVEPIEPIRHIEIDGDRNFEEY